MKASRIIAASLIAAGLLLPASMIVALSGEGASDAITLGAWLFKALVVTLGLYVLAGEYWGWWRARSHVSTHDTPRSKYPWLAMASLVALATVMRLHALDEGMWVDEVSTLVQYVRPNIGTIITTYDSQNQHLLYSILAHVSVGLFGESAWTLRLPAALFGIVSIWTLVNLGLLVTDRREAILAGLVLTLSYQHIWFSQNGRGYSGVLWFAMFSSILFIQGMRVGRPGIWVGYAVAVALGIYIHMTMLFVVFAQFTWYLWHRVRRLPMPGPPAMPFLVGFIPAGLLTLLLYGPVLPQVLMASKTDLSNVATWRSVSWMVRELLRGLQLGPALVVIAAAGAIVVAMGSWSYGRTRPIIPWLLAVSALTGGGIMIALQHHLWPRFFFFAVGFGVLIVVRGLTQVACILGTVVNISPQRRPLLGTIITVLAIAAMGRSLHRVYLPKQDFAGARHLVLNAMAPGDTVVVTGVAALAYGDYYEPSWDEVTSLDEIRSMQRTAKRIWLIYTLPIHLEAVHPKVMQVIRTDFVPVATMDGSLGDGAVYVSRWTGHPEPAAIRPPPR